MKTHRLKTWPEYYAAIADGRKTFEVRKDDRDFCIGDMLVLEEWNPETERYTGSYHVCRVTYLLRGGLGSVAVLPGYVAMGIEADRDAELSRLRARIAAAEKVAAKLRKDFLEYADHGLNERGLPCRYIEGHGRIADRACDCGLAAVLAACYAASRAESREEEKEK